MNEPSCLACVTTLVKHFASKSREGQRDFTHQFAMHHREVVPRHMPRRYLSHVQVVIPPVWTKVRPVVEQEQRMTRRVRIWPGVGRQVADTIFAPYSHDIGALVLGDRLGGIIAQSGHRGCEMGQEPWRYLLLVPIAQ